MYIQVSGQSAVGNNFHDCIGPGIIVGTTAVNVEVTNNIIAKNGGDGFTYNSNDAAVPVALLFSNNTIDGNSGHGIVLSTQAALNQIVCFNNIISNHTTAGKYGITVGAGTQAANDRVKMFFDYNTLYNNAGNYNAISPGAHDTVLSSDPYVGQSTENYTLA